MKEPGVSEYDGGGTQDNTLHPVLPGELYNASDELRLLSITGQTDDPNAAPDPYFWYGGVAPEVIVPQRKEPSPYDGIYGGY